MPRPEIISLADVLKHVSSTPVKPSALTAKLGVSRATVHRKLEALRGLEHVVRVGEGPQAAYRLPDAQEVFQRSRRDSPQGQVRVVMSGAAARALQDALELYSRLGIGQLEQITERARWSSFSKAQDQRLPDDDLRLVELLTLRLKSQLLGLPEGASFGIHNPKVHPSVLTLWTLQRALRHRLAWDRQPQGSIGVWHDEPLDGERLPGLSVHSDEPDDKGLPSRYVLEFPGELTGTVATALRFALRVDSGDPAAVLDMAAAGVLRGQDGGPVTAQALERAAADVAGLVTLLGGPAASVELSPTQALMLQACKALEEFVEKGGPARCELPGERAIDVQVVDDSPMAISLDHLPQGMMLNFQRGKYRVIAPGKSDGVLTIVAESHSLQTVLQMARNDAAGRRARDF